MIATARDDALPFDKTIIAEIVSLNNAETGEYYVEYQQGMFKAYASTATGIIYKGGTNVYVKIPGGDFSAKKIIEGQALGDGPLEEYFNYDASDLLKIYDIYQSGPDDQYSILANASPSSKYYEQVIYENNTNLVDDVFKDLFMVYPYIKLSADFKTSFKGEVMSGNYGLLVEFYVENDNESTVTKTYTLRLDVGNFSGSLYDYYTFTPQYAMYKIDTAVLTNIKKITFFQESFGQYDTYGDPPQVNNSTPNIFVKNINICFNEIQDDSGSLYQCHVSCSKTGLTLTQDSDVIKLTGHFRYANKDVLDAEKCSCYWFKQNPEIVAGHANYHQQGGPGWEQITDPDKVDFNELTLKGTDVYQSLRIKFVVIYNKSKTFVYELRNPIKKSINTRFSIVKKESEEDGTYLELLDGRDLQDKIKVDWYVLLEDGTYKKHNTEPTLKITIDEYANHAKVFYQALITLEDGTTKVPYDYTIEKKLDQGTVNVVFAGPDTFLYNSSGDITSNESKKEYVIKPSITTGENTFIKSITWKNSSDSVLYEMASTATNSMLVNVWADTDHNVHFQLYKKFQIDRNQNTLKLIIETVSGETFQFNKTINFVKEGEQGVNGLTYTMIIDQYDYNPDDKDSKPNEIEIKPMVYKPATKLWTPIYIKPHIYENGEEIVDEQKVYESGQNTGSYKIFYQTQGIGVDVTKDSIGIYIITGKESPETYTSGQFFVRFTATIELGGKTTTLNHYHPILIGYGDIEINQLKINNIPSRIIYNAAGGAPESNQEKINVVYKGTSQTDLFKPESLNDNIRIVEISSKYTIYPVQTYKGAYFPLETETNKQITPMGAIKITLSSTITNAYIIQPVVMVLSSQYNLGLGGYDGTMCSVIDEEDETLENTKEINSIVGAGTISSSGGTADPVDNGVIVGQETGNKDKYGVFLYNGTIPTNVLKSDGTAILGDGTMKFMKQDSKRIMRSESGAFEITESNNEETVSINGCMTIKYKKNIDGSSELSDISFGKSFIDFIKKAMEEGS